MERNEDLLERWMLAMAAHRETLEGVRFELEELARTGGSDEEWEALKQDERELEQSGEELSKDIEKLADELEVDWSDYWPEWYDPE